jgi:hypothetical protein
MTFDSNPTAKDPMQRFDLLFTLDNPQNEHS